MPFRRGAYGFRVSVLSPLRGGYGVPETLFYQISLKCPIGAGVRNVGWSKRWSVRDKNNINH